MYHTRVQNVTKRIKLYVSNAKIKKILIQAIVPNKASILARLHCPNSFLAITCKLYCDSAIETVTQNPCKNISQAYTLTQWKHVGFNLYLLVVNCVIVSPMYCGYKNDCDCRFQTAHMSSLKAHAVSLLHWMMQRTHLLMTLSLKS